MLKEEDKSFIGNFYICNQDMVVNESLCIPWFIGPPRIITENSGFLIVQENICIQDFSDNIFDEDVFLIEDIRICAKANGFNVIKLNSSKSLLFLNSRGETEEYWKFFVPIKYYHKILYSKNFYYIGKDNLSNLIKENHIYLYG